MTGALQSALERAGLHVRVETRENLAIIVPLHAGALVSDAQRRSAIALAAEHGFSHVALELID